MSRSLLLFTLLACVTVAAQGQTQPEAKPKIDPKQEMVSSGIPGIIAAGTKTEFLRGGFNGVEGVIGMPDGSVLFCEQNVNKVIKIDLEGTFSTYLEHTNRPIGLAYDPKGRLIAAQTNDPLVGVLAPTRTTLADTFEGNRLVRPNDLVIDRKGGIYFTDPIPAPTVQMVHQVPAGRKPLLFYITPEGKLVKLTEEVTAPNGLQLSPDEKTFYAVNGDHVAAFDVQPDGSVRNMRKFIEFAKETLPIDGMAVDNEGRLYVAAMMGVHVITPQGQRLGVIPAPVRMQSLGFAGKDRKTLYLAGEGNIYRVSLLAEGIKSRAK
jgi:gluconolactonase